jgi:hypothetical protein
MYAFDLAADNPVQARYLRVPTGTEFVLTSELPRAEQRAFAALGTLMIPDDRRFERRWTFVQNEHIARQRLRYLGVGLTEATAKDQR